MEYIVPCPHCNQKHPVQITDRQRHEEDMDLSLDYAKRQVDDYEPPSLKLMASIAIAMYEQKCLDHRSREINRMKQQTTAQIQDYKRQNIKAINKESKPWTR